MNLKKLAPWNWFKDEEESESKQLPVTRAEQNYYAPVSQLQQEINKVFDSVFRGFGMPTLGFDSTLAPTIQNVMLKPNVDIAASDKEYTITVEVPGVDENDIKLELVDNNLIIKGEKKHESETKEKHYYRVECSYGAFHRVLSLPEDADQDHIDARFKNGVLTITLPRREVAKSAGKVIDIKHS